MTFSDRSGDFVATAHSLSGPLRHLGDLGFTGSYTSLFKLPTWVPRKFIFSQNTTSAGTVVAPSVLWLTAFQLQASKALHVLYTPAERIRVGFCFFYTLCVYHSGTLIGHKHSQEQLIYKHASSQVSELWMFCPIERAQSWAAFLLISWVDAFASLHSFFFFFCQYFESIFFSFHCYIHLYFANVIYFLFFLLRVTELFFGS